MKKKYYNILFVFACILSSCSYVDIVPDNVATIDYAFRDRNGAEKFLATCYSYLPEFWNIQRDPFTVAGDDVWTAREGMAAYRFDGFYVYDLKFGNQNSSEPIYDFFQGGKAGRSMFIAMRDCNIFMENVNKVGEDLSNVERERWISEAKFLKAYYHYFLLRMYGPIPLIKENLGVDASIEEVRVFREPFDECVDYIVQLIDEAAPGLAVGTINLGRDYGHVTREAALAIKAELLATAASPLFNGNPDYLDVKDSRGRLLFSQEYDPQKWERAMIAAKEAINVSEEANRKLYVNDIYTSFDEATRLTLRLRTVVTERGNEEVLWGCTKVNTDLLQFLAYPKLKTDLQVAAFNSLLCAPLHIAEETFYSKNGVPLEEDIKLPYSYQDRYLTSSAPKSEVYIETGHITANLNQYREPRFYANLGFDGNIWTGNTQTTNTQSVLRGLYGQEAGKRAQEYNETGYWIKKFTSILTYGEGTNYGLERMVFPMIRLADVYLLYAEAKNEFMGPLPASDDAFFYLDEVRNRAGLEGVIDSWKKYSKYSDKPSTKEGLREIIQAERLSELAFEGKRYWDIRRWRRAPEERNRDIRGWTVDGTTPEEYYEVKVLGTIKFTTKEYLWPLGLTTLRKNNNLLQNPYWN